MTDDGFRDFVQVRYHDLLRTAYLLCGTRHGAEDLVHSALLRAMSRWDRIDDPLAYLRRVMVNQRVNLWRRIASRELLGVVAPQRDGRPDLAQSVADRDELMLALSRLPVRMRTVLVLRYWEDLSEADTAALLGCSIGSVKSQASRGLARLREALTAPPRPLLPQPLPPLQGRNS